MLLFAMTGSMWAQPAALDPTFTSSLQSGSRVNAVAVQTDGKILIGGNFYYYNGVSRNGIARLNTDGSLDTTFNPGTGFAGSFGAEITCITLQSDGKILVGGYFTTFNGTARICIARLNANGSLDTNFNPGAGAETGNGSVTPYVLSIAVQSDGKILVGGNFIKLRGVTRNYIGRLSSTGANDTSFTGTGTNADVYSIKIQSDGKIIIGGAFTSYSGTTRRRIARLASANGALDTTFNTTGTGLNNDVSCLHIKSDGKILAGGSFTLYNTTSVVRLVQLTSTGALDTSFNSGGTGANSSVNGIALQSDGKILICGQFDSYNGTNASQVARVNADGSMDASFNPGVSSGSYMYSITTQTDGKILIVGGFDTYNGTAINGVARLTDRCSVTTTWNGTAWSNGAPTTSAYEVIINGNLTVSQNLQACTLTVNSGNVIVNSGYNLTVYNNVTVAAGATLTFNSNSNLLQTNGVANTGNITFKKSGPSLLADDYIIWSSPVSGSQTLKQFSPNTPDNRFYNYNPNIGAYTNYISASGYFGQSPVTRTFTTGEGYLIKVPTAGVFTGTFTGNPNNGDISRAVVGNKYNAIGNPYPSPINIWNFIDGNTTKLDNGTLYFWRKTTAPGTGSLPSYTTITKAAIVVNSAGGGSVGSSVFTGSASNWVINPGQGFFVKAKTGATSITFKNTMRRAVNNNQLFRTANDEDDTFERFHLNLTAGDGGFCQAAVAYTPYSTADIDFGWDGEYLGDGAYGLYTLAGDVNLAIQALAPFTYQSSVPLGYTAAAAGDITIEIEQLEGLMSLSNTLIYLTDNVLGTTHNLKNGAYTFSTEPGAFNSRFTITYADSSMSVGDPIEKNNVLVYNDKGNVHITTANTMVKAVSIYDLRGRVLYNSDTLPEGDIIIPMEENSGQLLLVKVVTTDNRSIVKKIIL